MFAVVKPKTATMRPVYDAVMKPGLGKPLHAAQHNACVADALHAH
jgi:hypothetical protein